MKLKLFLFAISLLTITGEAFASSACPDAAYDMADGVLKVRQMPGTEQLLRQYLKTVNTKNDTIYALIYVPTYCKRCEVTSPVFHKQLKQLDSTQEIVLITVYKDYTAARKYNERNGYEADYYLYDSDNRYKKIFDFNTNGLYGLFVLKICKSSGNLIVGTEMDYLDLQNVKGLMERDIPMAKMSFSTNGESDTTYPEPQEQLIDTLKQKDYELVLPPQSLVSNVANVLSASDSLLFFYDELADGVMVFGRKGDEYDFKATITANDNEKKRFANVPKEVLHNMEDSKQLFYIPLFPRLSTDRQWIDVTYSLPDLRVTSREGNNVSVAYFNKPVIIRRNATTLQADSMSAFNVDVIKSDFMTQHFQFAEYGDTVFFGCKKKTFPIECAREDYEGNVAMNPFMDGFYDTPNPFIAAYSKTTGRVLTRFGHLDSCALRSKTGYAFVDVASETDGKDFVYTDGYSGKIYVSPLQCLDNVTETYSLFQPETDKFPEADTATYYKEEYVKPFNRFFFRQIETLRITPKRIYAFVRYGRPMDTDNTTGYVFATIDRRTGKATMRRLPEQTDGVLRGHGFMRSGDTFVPAVLLKRDGKITLLVF